MLSAIDRDLVDPVLGIGDDNDKAVFISRNDYFLFFPLYVALSISRTFYLNFALIFCNIVSFFVEIFRY